MATKPCKQTTLAFIEYLLVFIGVAGCLLLKIDRIQSNPYMDEIFHVPQAQKYCNGLYSEWDPMLTTLPGLYIASIVVVLPTISLLNVSTEEACSVFSLRSINILFALGNVIVLWLLIKKINKDDKKFTDGKLLLAGLALSLFPTLYFFTFLYYTDVGSTFFVLLMYLFSLHERHMLSSFAAAVAILFRQTNVVWVVFVAGIKASELVIDDIKPEKKDFTQNKLQGFEFTKFVLSYLIAKLRKDARSLVPLVKRCFAQLWPYAFVVVCFLAFVYVNGGIVVGDKQHHQVSFHVPQIFYFLSFTTIFSWSQLVTPIKVINFIMAMTRNPHHVIYFCVLSILLVYQFTFAHSYLLADNRHYPFYLWSKVYRRHELMKYALIPCYCYSMWTFFDSLSHKNGLWKTIFAICLSVNLIPQLLLEFRYFIIPFLIFKVNLQRSTYHQYLIEIVYYVLINIFTIYMFIEKGFKWDNSDDIQRFMW